jgi:hypothetical protein
MGGFAYGLLDGKSVALMYLIKLYRIMCLWAVLYLMDKVYQIRFLERVFVEDAAPPSLMYWPFVLIAAESSMFLLMFAIILVMERRFKSVQNTFVIDETLLLQLLTDYVLTTLSMFLTCNIVVNAVMNCSTMRYKHDGMRGIRSASRLMFSMCATILAVPCFLAY